MLNRPVILLTGASGQLGSELLPRLQPLGSVIAPNRREMDLRHPEQIRSVLRSIRPSLIVNAAAHTGVDQAETDEPVARSVNADAPAFLAQEAKRIGAALVHFSTDYVFDGAKNAPYLEEDPPNPLNVYGRNKLAGEEAIRASGVPYLIFRTSWLYASHGKNFLLTILRLATEREELKIVNDQLGAPTCASDFAAAIRRILTRLASASDLDEAFSRIAGTYHCTAGGTASWHEFATAILRDARQTADLAWTETAVRERPFRVTRIVPITTAQFGAPARRPAYSVLCNNKMQRTFGIVLPDWREQLRSYFAAAPAERESVSQLTSS
jgi:dTDP-4-dehydrorhamnose reductase